MSEVPEMVERVARAMCNDREPGDAAGGAHPSGIMLDHGEAWWSGYIDQARAAIEAMREPTEAMQVAGATTDVAVARTADGDGRCLTPNHIWRAMIDIGLSGKSVEEITRPLFS